MANDAATDLMSAVLSDEDWRADLLDGIQEITDVMPVDRDSRRRLEQRYLTELEVVRMEFIQIAARLWQNNLSDEEMRNLARFHRSPMGQRIKKRRRQFVREVLTLRTALVADVCRSVEERQGGGRRGGI